MEILLTLAYVFLVRLVFFEYRWLPWNLATGIAVFGLYTAAAARPVCAPEGAGDVFCQYR